jgi:hypothetical protein
LENDNYKLYFDRTVLTDIHIKHNRPDIINLNKQQKQAYLLDIAVPNSHNITQTYNTKINKYLELSVAMRNLWCLEKISILPLIISATGIVPQSLFKKLKILDLENTLVVEIQNSILCTEGVKWMIFTRGAICSPRVLQNTEGKNHSVPRSIYYFLHDSPILIEKSRKFVNYH